MESKQLALLCHQLADDKKAEDIVILDVSEVSGITDYFVIATGTSEPHLRAINAEITLRLKKERGLKPEGTDGHVPTNWVALDFFDVIVHLMLPETREHYDLESLWSDAPRLDLELELKKLKDAEKKSSKKPPAKKAASKKAAAKKTATKKTARKAPAKKKS